LETVVIEKSRLLERLKQNRETHKAAFEQAWEGFRERAIQNFEQRLKAAKDARRGQQIELWVNLDVPREHTADYDTAIEMLEWHTEDEIELTYDDFRHYVQDEWHWKGEFVALSAAYSPEGRS
jgi:hypothetical protein